MDILSVVVCGICHAIDRVSRAAVEVVAAIGAASYHPPGEVVGESFNWRGSNGDWRRSCLQMQ